MTKNILASIVVVVLVVWGGYKFFNPTKVETTTPAPVEQVNTTSNPEQATVPQETEAQPINKTNPKSNMVTIDTNYGKIVIEMYESDAPNTVANFVSLATKKFYDGLTFHRVIKGFMIQGGDPNGNGTGGPGYSFPDELNPNTDSYKAGYKKGVVAMANAGPNTNGSQFFIMTADYPLPNNYTIFGKVVSGQEVVDKIAVVQTGANDKPVSPVTMKTVTVN